MSPEALTALTLLIAESNPKDKSKMIGLVCRLLINKRPDPIRMKTRLNKFLADRGVCSRREADRMIADGLVQINGVVAKLGTLVDEAVDDVAVRGKLLTTGRPKPIIIAFHKPIGLITSADERLHDNVITYLGFKERIFPVGRLDVASSGLLLLTNDGRLSEAITHPRYDHEKEYEVTVDRPIKAADLHRLESGLIVLGSRTKTAPVERVNDRTFRIILTEGRNRQIRRMCEEIGYEVIKLKRIRVMNIKLGALPIGEWRELTDRESSLLRDLLREPGKGGLAIAKK